MKMEVDMNLERKEQDSESSGDIISENLIETPSDMEESVTSKQTTLASVAITENRDLTVKEETSGQPMEVDVSPVNFYNLSLLNHFDVSLIHAIARHYGLQSHINRFRPFTHLKPSDRLSSTNSDNQKKVHRRA